MISVIGVNIVKGMHMRLVSRLLWCAEIIRLFDSRARTVLSRLGRYGPCHMVVRPARRTATSLIERDEPIRVRFDWNK